LAKAEQLDITKNEFVTKFKEFNITGMIKKIKKCNRCLSQELCADHMLEKLDTRTKLEKMRDGEGPKLFTKINHPYPEPKRDLRFDDPEFVSHIGKAPALFMKN
jgi:hypothetical protein